MHRAPVLIASLSLAAFSAAVTLGQNLQNPSPIQARKEFTLGRMVGEDLERRAGLIAEPMAVDYLQRIANKLVGAASAKSFEVKVTRTSDPYALLLPHGVLYLSGGFVERLASEAELAGLLAHELAHTPSTLPPSQGGTIPLLAPPCVLASRVSLVPRSAERQEAERQATEAAVMTLKRAGYDPSAVLDLFSKLVYDFPRWANVISPEDILRLRVSVEAEVPPQKGYITDSSEFIEQHQRIVSALRPAAHELHAPTSARPADRTH